jgi:hypothetical protein
MNKFHTSVFGIALAITLQAGGMLHAETITVRPTDNGEALVNPGMGWTLHYYSNIPTNYGSKLAPSDTIDYFPGLSTIYLRIPWCFLEPEEGRFNWPLLDTPAQRWIDRGLRVAFRFTTSENWNRSGTPDWVIEAGAERIFYKFGQGPVPEGESPLWDPVYDDPVFLEKLGNFLEAAGRRYNGNPNVDFIDVGTFGMWGEGHTHMASQVAESDLLRIQKLHIDLHLKHFPDTQLCISDDFVGHDRPGTDFEITNYALSRGVSLRDDSILVQPTPRQWYHAELAGRFWPTLPVILEHEHYGSSVLRGAWKDGSQLLEAVELYHASYMSIHWWPDEFYQKNKDLIEKINLRLGYRILPTEITWPDTIPIDEWFTVNWTWANRGVAPCLPGGFPALTIKDDQGGIVSVLVDEGFNARDLTVGEPDQAPPIKQESRFRIGHIAPAVQPGEYQLFLSLGERGGTPRIALPLPADDGHRRYFIGNCSLE